jgi:tetratricopeptide (TPR) repeat protein
MPTATKLRVNVKPVLIAVVAGGLLMTAGILFERKRTPEGATRQAWSASRLLNAARAGSTDAFVYLELARRFRQQNRYAEALNLLQKAARLRPDSAEVYFEMGWIYRQLGRKDDAVEPLRHAVKLDSRFAAARLELGQAYNAIGHRKEAIEEFRHYVDLEPDDDDGYYWLGAVALSAGMTEVGLKSLEKARSLNPHRAVTHLALGNYYLLHVKGKEGLNKALEFYQRAAELDPTTAEPVELIATVYYRQQRYADAAREFEHALRIDPRAAEVYYPLGLSYARIGEKAKSKRCLEIAAIYNAGKEAFVRPGGAVAESAVEQGERK